MTYEFNLVDYAIDTNSTSDSYYAQWSDQSTGKLVACNVASDKSILEQSRSSVDREPLVQVLVKAITGYDENGEPIREVVLDGYILIHITDTIPEEKANTTIAYPEFNYEFDLCSSTDVDIYTIWSQFNELVLTNGLSNMTKEEFDKYYSPDVVGSGELFRVGDVDIYYMNVFKVDEAVGSTNTPEADADYYDNVRGRLTQYNGDYCENGEYRGLIANGKGSCGDIMYEGNTEGPTNHTFKWVLSAKELETLTHHMINENKTSVQVSRYVRFYANAAYKDVAPYPYVYIKLTVNITRMQNPIYAFTGKNQSQYWWSLAGDASGNEGTIFDVQAPRPNENIIGNYIGDIHQHMETTNTSHITKNGNVVGNIDGDGVWTGSVLYKYYFVPGTISITDEYTNAVYTITQGTLNAKYRDASNYQHNVVPTYETVAGDRDKLYCLYENTPSAGVNETSTYPHAYPTTTATDGRIVEDATSLKALLQTCAIKYNKGAFLNNTLIGTANGQTDIIAILDQHNGQITLQYNDVTKAILNAQGYKGVKSQIIKQLYANVGVVAEGSGCHYASYVESPFVTSFSRPINVTDGTDDILDARTNENHIYLKDILKLSDWRNYDMPDANGNNLWFWTYYNVNSITIDCRPSVVKVRRLNADGSDVDGGYVQLSEVTDQLQLYAYYDVTSTPFQTSQWATYKFWNSFNVVDHMTGGSTMALGSGISVWDTESDNVTFLNDMSTNPQHYGYIYYQNNTGVVKKFYIKVPVTVHYYWGDIERVLTIFVDDTDVNNN